MGLSNTKIRIVILGVFKKITWKKIDMGIAITTMGVLLAIVYVIIAAVEFMRGDDKKAIENIVISVLIMVITWVLYTMLIEV